MSQQFILETDVQYGEGGGEPLLLDILRPAAISDEPRPAIVYVHGGGWMGGDRSDGITLNLMLARMGFFTVTISYRFSQVAPFPAQIHDVKAAIRFLRANAERFGIDPGRIGVWGHSAGGHLSALAGLSADIPELEGESGSPGYSSGVQAVVPMSPPTDFTLPWTGPGAPLSVEIAIDAIDRLLGGTPEEKPDLARLASPAALVQPGDAPSLILHGTADELVAFRQAELLAEAMQRAGNEAELMTLTGVDHNVVRSLMPGSDDAFGTREAVTTFFSRHLGPLPDAGSAQ
ncbi:MAG TPA: alpha/beta hydrolase [Thermomicrobiales bacterium]|nr:alpha/beta hydrolase [Thermomicrobiales bacterium]